MASVVLDRVWLNDAADLSDSLSFQSSNRGDRERVGGSVRAYANGRQRLVSTATTTLTLPLVAVAVSWADVEWLREHAGRLLLLRDKPGRRVWGTYFSVDVDDRARQESHNVQIEFQRLSFDEAV